MLSHPLSLKPGVDAKDTKLMRHCRGYRLTYGVMFLLTALLIVVEL